MKENNSLGENQIPVSFSEQPVTKKQEKKGYKYIVLVVLLVIVITAGLTNVIFRKTGQIKKNNVAKISTAPQPSKNIAKKYGYPVIQLPSNAAVQTEYKGIKFIHTPKSVFSDQEVNFLKYFIDLTPKRLLTPGPKVILTYDKDEINFGPGGAPIFAVAFASGDIILFNNKSFNPKTLSGFLSDTSVDSVLQIFLHELTHVSQYHSIDDAFLAKAQSEDIDESKLIERSPLVSDFALSTGWNLEGKAPFLLWKLKSDQQSQKTTSYAKSSGPQEDMADSVANFIIGKDNELSDQRLQWVKNWLNQDYQEISQNYLPVYPGYKKVNYLIDKSPVDENTLNEFKQKYSYVEELNFATESAGLVHELARKLDNDLNNRRWQGILQKENDSKNVVYYKGFYTGKYRDLDVMFKSYDEATGYAVKPNGTQLVIIAGYKL